MENDSGPEWWAGAGQHRAVHAARHWRHPAAAAHRWAVKGYLRMLRRRYSFCPAAGRTGSATLHRLPGGQWEKEPASCCRPLRRSTEKDCVKFMPTSAGHKNQPRLWQAHRDGFINSLYVSLTNRMTWIALIITSKLTRLAEVTREQRRATILSTQLLRHITLNRNAGQPDCLFVNSQSWQEYTKKDITIIKWRECKLTPVDPESFAWC